MSPRTRLAALLAVIVVAATATGAYVFRVHGQQAVARAVDGPARTDLASATAGPHLVFRNTALGNGYGSVAVVPLAAPDGPRAITPASCERVYAVAGKAVCLSATRGLSTTYRAQLLGADWSPARDLSLTGIPSRARLSRDGALVATTTFVYGDAYANPGQFSTQTLVTRTDGVEIGNLEQFELVVDGRPVTASDKNLWGVTFADDDRFFATAASGGRTWLVSGSLSARRITAVRQDAECPSLSPDGTRIAFKKHGNLPPGQWRLAVYDLRTGGETVLAETRSVDDQVEWLDNLNLLYGLPRTGTSTATSDVWTVPADGGGAPRVLVPDAWSPAVVR
jgi:hypothetical protein